MNCWLQQYFDISKNASRAGWESSAGRMWPAGRRLPPPDLTGAFFIRFLLACSFLVNFYLHFKDLFLRISFTAKKRKRRDENNNNNNSSNNNNNSSNNNISRTSLFPLRVPIKNEFLARMLNSMWGFFPISRCCKQPQNETVKKTSKAWPCQNYTENN